ncbi:hypothetical protein SAMN06265337_1217 [Hymenobacter gelipurpurascens]|uniref:Uncharacterized protein n=1 Tax=Hymenobacter gelipurpurascens TaxID=89968 RepID=A0A212TGU9_9BACT|nr:hypothetical protein [Hymenobacter gelipurpurascens]SNC65110.1 hypothetical protein SAMN06265337_1217 [Hymenobacter gelipurpurascens]
MEDITTTAEQLIEELEQLLDRHETLTFNRQRLGNGIITSLSSGTTILLQFASVDLRSLLEQLCHEADIEFSGRCYHTDGEYGGQRMESFDDGESDEVSAEEIRGSYESLRTNAAQIQQA